MLLDYLPQIIGTLITFSGVAILKFITKRLVHKYGHMNHKFETRINQVVRIFNILLNLAGLITLIIIWGMDTRNIFVALSSVFAVIGVALFAQWSLLSNITAGIIIYFSAPFKIGDYIRILDKEMPLEARVEDIYTFYTHLRTKDGGVHIFPNSLLLQKAVSVIDEKELKPDDQFPTFNSVY
jgi:MscS family membrane protein